MTKGVGMSQPFGGRIWLSSDDATADEDLAMSDSATLEDLLRLCHSKSDKVRAFCAMRNDTPAHLLTEMSDDSEIKVRRAVAYNTNTPLDVIRKLAFDPEEKVRWGAAQNKKAPPHLLLVLAQDSRGLVFDAAVHNPNAPPAVKVWLQSGQYGGMSLKEFLEATNGH